MGWMSSLLAVPGREGRTLVYGAFVGRCLLVAALDEGGLAFIITAWDMTDAGKKALRGKAPMTMTDRDESPPRTAAELEQLVGYYDSRDLSAWMEHGAHPARQDEGQPDGIAEGEGASLTVGPARP